MVNLLLLDCYRDPGKVKIKPYRDFIHSAFQKKPNIVILKENNLPSSFDRFDGVFISGARRMIVEKQYKPALLDLIARNQKPLLGICYGHQLLVTAFGCDVKKEKRFHEGKEEIKKIKDDHILKGFPEHFFMEQSHQEYVVRNEKLEKWFSVLAVNQKNQVEIIKHRFLPAYGVQFHPEKSGTLGIKLLGNFLSFIPN
jgi:GMP synthase-like glutamine amidotransferase